MEEQNVVTEERSQAKAPKNKCLGIKKLKGNQHVTIMGKQYGPKQPIVDHIPLVSSSSSPGTSIQIDENSYQLWSFWNGTSFELEYEEVTVLSRSYQPLNIHNQCSFPLQDQRHDLEGIVIIGICDVGDID